MHETLLYVGGGAGALVALFTAIRVIFGYFWREATHKEEKERAARDATRDAESKAMLKLIADQSKIIDDLEHRLSTLQQTVDVTIQRVVKVETVLPSINTTMGNLEVKVDKIIDKLMSK